MSLIIKINLNRSALRHSQQQSDDVCDIMSMDMFIVL